MNMKMNIEMKKMDIINENEHGQGHGHRRGQGHQDLVPNHQASFEISVRSKFCHYVPL
jgi:hypothetical protein